MIPPFPIYPDRVTYVPSLVAPNQILLVTQAEGQVSPLSPRDLYFMQRVNIPIGQTWAVFGNNPPSAHFVQMGMLPPMAPTYCTVLMGPLNTEQFTSTNSNCANVPSPPPDVFDPLYYESTGSSEGQVEKNA